MPMRKAVALVLLGAVAAAAPREVDEVFRGEVVGLRGGQVLLHYDFSSEDQLEDFERAQPAHLPADGRLLARIENEGLVLDGTGALRHRAAARGRSSFRARVRITQRGNCGAFVSGSTAPGPAVLVNLFDKNLKREGGLLMAAIEPAGGKDPVVWRELATAPPAEVGKQIVDDAVFELTWEHDGFLDRIRVGSLWRQRSSEGKTEALPAHAAGFWVHEAALRIEELWITIEPDPAWTAANDIAVALARRRRLADAKAGALARTIKEAPLSLPARAAAEELGHRDADAWKKLTSVIQQIDRKTPYAAVPLIPHLAAGPEPERVEFLLRILKRSKAPDVRGAVLVELARRYPAHADVVHAGLAEDVPQRLEVFRLAAARGLDEAVLKACCQIEALAPDAYALVRDRGAALEAAELGRLPRLRALEGFSPAASRAFLKEFGERPNWPLARALCDLLEDEDPEVRKGAHLLLLTISGKDIAPLKDLWRSWIAAKQDAYETPPWGAPGVVTAAIHRGTQSLLRDLGEDGACVWPVNPDWPGTRVGATALAVVALRVAGVPADDPVIRKAVRTTLLVNGDALRGDLEDYTYCFSLLAMALTKVDAKKHRPLIEILAKRLADGQLENGQWTYYCRRTGYGGRRPKAGDNSNTQYAILGLRAARRAGVEVDPEVFRRNLAFWVQNQNGNGGWGYGLRGTTKHELSMTAAGVATVGICLEALHGAKAFGLVREDKQVTAGMVRLGELLLEHGFEGQEIYTWYTIERAGILTGTRAFDDFDWYEEGASILVQQQKESGAWGREHPHGIAEGLGYGEEIDTAYALLFLKRATTGLPGAEGGAVIEIPGAERLKAKRRAKK